MCNRKSRSPVQEKYFDKVDVLKNKGRGLQVKKNY